MALSIIVSTKDKLVPWQGGWWEGGEHTLPQSSGCPKLAHRNTR